MSKKLLMNVNDPSLTESIRKYYQEMSGSFITASDISASNTLDTERFIEITEIFGNTIQDSTDLSIIESLGVWNESKKGYEIDILSSNKNLFDKNIIPQNVLENYDGRECLSIMPITEYSFTKPLKLSSGTYFFSMDVRLKNVSNYVSLRLKTDKGVITSADYVSIGEFVNKKYRFILEEDVVVDSISFGSSSNGCVGVFDINTIQVEKNTIATTYIPFEQNKTTILLPCQLQKVGTVADRLYWDSVKCRYVVEKNVFKNIYNGNENYSWGGHELEGFYSCYTNAPSNIIQNTINIISNTHKYGNNNPPNSNVIWNYSDRIYVKFNENVIGGKGAGYVKSWILSNNIEMYYEGVPQLIETNIAEKIKVPTYANKTHILTSSTNGIDCSNSKVLVPYKELT